MADKTTSRITIAAPRAAVMDIIADFARYPQWASGVRAAAVVEPEDREPHAAGRPARPARVRFTLDAGMIRDTYVLGYQWDGDAQVRWTLAEPGSMVSAMSGAYLLDESAAGTDVTYELAVGIRVPMPGMLKRRAEKTIIDTALKGLRSRAERA